MLKGTLKRNIACDLDLLENLWTVNGAPDEIDQLITNLVLNAFDAMPEGGSLDIRTRNIDFDEHETEQHPEVHQGRFVRLVVADTGCGMDEKTMGNIFDPFFTTKGSDGGTGLGLSVVYGIVQTHDGWISVDSKPGQGTRFEVFLPALHEG